MKKIMISLALASAAISAPVAAQALPPAVVVIVDMDNVFANSAAGKLAQAELKTRLDGIQARLAQLRTSFGAEEQTLGQTRPTAAGPAATAWEAKVKDFTTRKTQAETELQQRDQAFQASRQFVLKQLNDGAQPIITQIMKERGASIALAEGATLQHSASIDVTADVIARLDKAVPRVSSTAPAAAPTK
ncbi:OmpH family outer membrane protein [Sandarakinorhabdus sp.]|uniref:OmpH family outer membrane protein n=1 Tax=Sandarakinorhabdus sp. TaxID=1916663 RepID=UPI00286EA389|nr:OmpH family outer membrane protein [Sandarakinorhabdus sp.]